MRLIAPHPDVRVSFTRHYTAKTLLTATESKLYTSLAKLSQGRCIIACKPRLADFIQHYDRTGFNKISQKHVDFLICRIEDGMPMMGIELDDPSHEAADRKKRDIEVNGMFASIGLPLLRIPVAEMDQVERFLGELDRAWNRRTETLLHYQSQRMTEGMRHTRFHAAY